MLHEAPHDTPKMTNLAMFNTTIAWLMTFASYNLHNDCLTCTFPMTTDSLPLKALLNTFGICHKTHTMTTRYENHDTEDFPASRDTDTLDLVHQTTLYLNEKVNHQMNTVRNLTLAIILLSHKINSSNLRTNSLTWNLPPTCLHIQRS